MGYAGYVSAKYPPPKPTEVEAAVQAIKSEAGACVRAHRTPARVLSDSPAARTPLAPPATHHQNSRCAIGGAFKAANPL